MIYKSKYKQSIFDIAAENFGSLNNVVDIVRANRVTFDSSIVTGTELVLLTDDKGDEDIKRQTITNGFNNNNYDPLPQTSTGIGFMIIESTFIIG